MTMEEFFERTVRSYPGASEARYRLRSLDVLIARKEAELDALRKERDALQKKAGT